MAQDSNHVRKSLNIKPNTSPDLSQTGDLGADASDSNRLKYNRGTGAQRVLLQEDAAAGSFTAALNVTYDHTSSGLTATNAQTAIDQVEARVDTAETNITTNATNITTNATNLSNHISNTTGAHAATAISVTPSGSVTSTNVQAAFADLDSAKASSSFVLSHTGSSAAHGATGAVVGTTNVQTLTNKTLDSPTFTGVPVAPTATSGTNTTQVATTAFSATAISTHAALTATHGVSGAVVGTTDTQTLTNKTLTAPVIDVATMTDQGSTPANPAAGKHKLYIKSSDGKAYILDSSGVEVVVGGTTITTVDPTAFTPVINGSTTNVTLGTGAVQQGTWWRVGKNLHCDITVVLGTSPTAGSGNAQIPTPSGVTIDTSALGTGARQIVGSGYVQTGGAGSNFPVAVVAATSNVTYVMMEVITGTGTSLNAASAYNTVGNFIKIHFRVPIVGW